MDFKSNFYSNTFTDLLFNILVGIVFLFILALLLINPIAKDATVKKNAEWIIEMSWPNDNDCDMDLWVRDPDGNVVSFKKKAAGMMHIERDDLGRTTDIFTDSSGNKFITDENREIWTLRGKMEGEYVVNIHAYTCRDDEDAVQLMDGTKITKHKEVGDAINVPVTVKIIRVNPSYLTFKTVTVDIKEVWEEVTAMIIDITKNSAIYLGNDYIRLVDAKK